MALSELRARPFASGSREPRCGRIATCRRPSLPAVIARKISVPRIGRYNRTMNQPTEPHHRRRRLPSAPRARARRTARRGRRRRDRADRAGSAAQPRRRLPVPARQLLLLSDRLYRARGAAGARRERAPDGRRRSCSAARRTPSARSGKASVSVRTRARDAFGFDAAFPFERTRHASAAVSSRTSRRCTMRSAHRRELDAQVRRWLDAVRAQARSGVAAPDRRARSAAAARRDAAFQGRPRTRDHAPRRTDFRAGASPRDGRMPRRHARIRTRSRAAVHFRKFGAQAPAYARSSRRARTPACCTTRAGNAIAQRWRSDPDRCRPASSTATHRTSRAPFPRTAASPARSASCTTSCSPRSRRRSTRRAPAPLRRRRTKPR